MAYTSPPPTAEPLLEEKPFGDCINAAMYFLNSTKAQLWKPSPRREKVSSRSETDEGERSGLHISENAAAKSLRLKEKAYLQAR